MITNDTRIAELMAENEQLKKEYSDNNNEWIDYTSMVYDERNKLVEYLDYLSRTMDALKAYINGDHSDQTRTKITAGFLIRDIFVKDVVNEYNQKGTLE